jgi:circadian clock protein KaiB
LSGCSRFPKDSLDQLSLSTFSSLPELYKGLVLFTPGGDVVYCIDVTKRQRWHYHLCTALQEWLDLPEPPLFLSPCYTATIDRWFDPQQQQISVLAEAYPLVLPYQTHLNALFETENLVWQPIAPTPQDCDPLVLQSYKTRFPQLWEPHNLVLRLDQAYLAPKRGVSGLSSSGLNASSVHQGKEPEQQGYILRLFVSGHSTVTADILKNLHHHLADALPQPYTLKIIDVLKNPEQAELDQVIATPTLVKAWPLPVRKLVGGLEQPDKLAKLLQ